MPKGISNSSSIATIKELVPDINKKLKWLSNPNKDRKSRGLNYDVSIRNAIKSRDKKTGTVKSYTYSFTFRNDVGAKFKEKYLDVAILDDRLYFRPSKNGQFSIHSYKLTSDKSKVNANIGIQKNDKTECIEKFIGDYDLKYDKVYELFYIEIPEMDS